MLTDDQRKIEMLTAEIERLTSPSEAARKRRRWIMLGVGFLLIFTAWPPSAIAVGQWLGVTDRDHPMNFACLISAFSIGIMLVATGVVCLLAAIETRESAK